MMTKIRLLGCTGTLGPFRAAPGDVRRCVADVTAVVSVKTLSRVLPPRSSRVIAKARWSRQAPLMWRYRSRRPSSRNPSLRTTARLAMFSGRMFTSIR